jgi:hypothetical protein
VSRNLRALRSGFRVPRNDRSGLVVLTREVPMFDRNVSYRIRRVKSRTQERPSRWDASRPRLAAIIVVVVLGICTVSAAPTVAADGTESPIPGGDPVTLVVVRAATLCPDPPAHLPEAGFRLELSDLDGPWTPMTTAILESKEIRVQLTVRRDGFGGRDVDSFALGPFRMEPIAGRQQETSAATPVTAVGDLQPGVVYFARALVLVGDEWISTGTTKFMTPICAVDGLEGEEVSP